MEEAILECKLANFIGIERIDEKGRRHIVFTIRGMGNCRLDSSGLRFVQFISRREIFIPIEKITEVSLGWWHAGKFKGVKLLKVVYQTDGEKLSVGFRLHLRARNTLKWKEKIEELKRK